MTEDLVKVKKSTRDGYGEGLLVLGRDNSKVVALSADLADSTRVLPFREKYPKRYIEVGIAEQNLVGVASGLSLVGWIPFASSFGSFMIRAADHIRVTVAYGNLNVKLVTTHNGITAGEDGASAQMMEDIGFFRSLPNFTIVVPADACEARKATIALANKTGPAYLRLGRQSVDYVTDQQAVFAIGKADVLCDGTDVSLIACGSMVKEALLAAEELKEGGIFARVVNMHTLKPLDKEMIVACAKETKTLVTAEEHQIYGGLGGAVAEVVAQYCPVPMELVAMPDSFGRSGKGEELLYEYGLSSEGIVKAVKRAIARKNYV